MANGPLFLLLGALLLILVAGIWVITLHRQPVALPTQVVHLAGQNHPTVGRFNYLLSDYLDVEKQLRDKRSTEEHALKVARLRDYEQFTTHQAQLAEEQAQEQAAWETSQEAIAQWLEQQQRTDTQLNPPLPPPPPPVDFSDASLSPAKRRKAIFKQLTAAADAVVA